MNEAFIKQLLLDNNENELFELKKAESTFSKDELGKYFSALSNEANLNKREYAYLLFGINDDKVIVGSKISDTQLDEFKLEVFKQTSPQCSFSAVERICIDGKDVILFEIPKCSAGHPMRWKGHCYGRNGESIGALEEFEYERIKGQVRTDWSSKIVAEATMADLDKQAILIARENFKVKNSRVSNEVDNWDDITFLNKAKLLISGQITTTALLLLGKSESTHWLTPAISQLTWILKDVDGIEKDYEHFSSPLLLTVSDVFKKIRNLKYRYIRTDSLFPEEVEQYDPYIIREALNNCIAHQDYLLGGKIVVTESEDGYLLFSNAGDFLPGSIEKVIQADAPQLIYRNKFLVDAMVQLNMIDTIGSGIRKMFRIQKDKYFPLPDYSIGNSYVEVKVMGKVLNMDYARKLAKIKSLSLDKIILLDKVAKGLSLTEAEIHILREDKLIEGRKPNLIISSTVAKQTNQKGEYVKQKGFEDETIELAVVDYLRKFKQAQRTEIEEVLFKHLPSVLTLKQKKDKIKNVLQKLKRDQKVSCENRLWYLKKE
ncbi:putative DNA binding domain-containing protein [Myroides sp. M-43]|uniref:RNA-binding domain-containing protein n=1 Tax=Myroides oncorhynchi TaxID=2893756 RepID=UPI001E4748AF|nr:RNA-binding domain-containing protein [Myroides oncorhynchi]MCC9043711.1 putative DNA binding domain-containing protein [Myroides oncorhynchi]